MILSTLTKRFKALALHTFLPGRFWRKGIASGERSNDHHDPGSGIDGSKIPVPNF